MLATLPSYLGKTEADTEILPFPSSGDLIPPAKDALNLQAILLAPVTATLSLMDFLKVKPEMWLQVAKMLKSKGYEMEKRNNLATGRPSPLDAYSLPQSSLEQGEQV